MTTAPEISVVLPTYNERETILSVLHELEQALVCSGCSGWEVIVVDDDSDDLTWELVRDHYGVDSRVRVIRRTEESGLSSAVLTGFREATGKALVCMDADGQHPAEKVSDLVAASDGGFAVGSRHTDGGEIEGWPWSRRVISSVAKTVSHVGIPSSRRLSDPMSGFFAVDSEVVTEDVIKQADPHGYKILLELVVSTKAPINEVPITFDCRQAGESKLTVDEQVHFLEHTADLGLDDRGFNFHAPLLIRSVELGMATGSAVLLLLVGIIVGGLDGAVGAGLIGGSGALFSLAMVRYLGTEASWEDSTV